MHPSSPRSVVATRLIRVPKALAVIAVAEATACLHYFPTNKPVVTAMSNDKQGLDRFIKAHLFLRRGMVVCMLGHASRVGEVSKRSTLMTGLLGPDMETSATCKGCHHPLQALSAPTLPQLPVAAWRAALVSFQ